MKNQRKAFLAQAIALSLTALAAQSAQASDYVFSDLGTITGPNAIYAGADGINNLGQVVGFTTPTNLPTIWNGGSRTPLALLPGSASGIAIGINNVGQSVGWVGAGADTVPVRWDGTAATALTPLAPGYSIAWSINDLGQAAGFGLGPDGNFHAVTWNGTAPTDLGGLGGTFSVAYRINDTGQIVGSSDTVGDEASHAVQWSNGSFTDLGTLGGNNSSASGINNAGQIVGDSVIADGITTHAAYWASATSAPADLGSLGGESYAKAINSSGQIVGYSFTADGSRKATLWDASGIHDLNSYLPADLAAAGWNLYYATFINDNGVIVGVASSGPNPAASTLGIFQLTPTAVPIPGAVWLFGSAIAGLLGGGLRNRQRVLP